MSRTYLQHIRDRRATFIGSWSERPTDQTFVGFLDLLIAILRADGSNAIDVYACIASLMFVPGLDDEPLRAEIMVVAGDLETGEPAAPKHTPDYLRGLIDELRTYPTV